MEKGPILESWKEVAAYLKKSEKTCRRWEHSHGLPVRRLDGSPRAHIFAYKEEIDLWLEEMLQKKLPADSQEMLRALEAGGEGKTPEIILSALRLPEEREYDLKALFRLIKKPRISVPLIVVLAVIGFTLGYFLNRAAKIRWAKYQAIPEIEQLITKGDNSRAFALAKRAQEYIPKDDKLVGLMARASSKVSFTTAPPQADVYLKEYSDIDGKWEHLGETPLENLYIPRGYFRWKMEKAGYLTAEGIADTSEELLLRIKTITTVPRLLKKIDLAEVLREPVPTIHKGLTATIHRDLLREGSIPQGMILISGGMLYTDIGVGDIELKDFFIDRYEVTNKQFKDFIDSGGYRNPSLWKHPFIKAGRQISRAEALAEFVDSTGRPGPSTWKVGDFPEGEDDYPVRGISWYEAAAYAEFAGKSLPSVYHWIYAAGLDFFIGYRTFIHITALSNFGTKGPVQAGALQGISPFGAYDMAGNVREWCFNKTGDRRCVLGASWVEQSKLFRAFASADGFDRSELNGLRCVTYIDPSKITNPVTDPIAFSPPPDYRNEKPCSDETFKAIQKTYEYDKGELEAQISSRDLSFTDFVLERVSFNAAYDGQRMVVYICIPKSFHPPYQIVVYFPGDTSMILPDPPKREELEYWDFLMKTGRAFIWPAYMETLDRGGGGSEIDWKSKSWLQELLIKWYRDLARSIDYLETRPEFDANRIAYLGWSMGAKWGPIFAALEKRIKCLVMIGGGFRNQVGMPPAVRQANFALRVSCPVLMVNGRFDISFPMETAQIPLFKIFGTPREQKRHFILNTDHSIWIKRDLVIKEILDWLDKYLGPVN